MLSTFDPLIRTNRAALDYGCAGNGENQRVRQFAPACERIIRRGSEYIETLETVPAIRATPRLFNVVSRHCAECALAFFPRVNVTEAIQ